MSEKTLGEQLWTELCWGATIAARIEAEYTPNSVVKNEYVKLPIDADGVLWRGDEKEYITGEDRKHTMLGMTWDGIAWVPNFPFLTENDQPWKAEYCHHVKPTKLTKEEIDAKAKTSCQKYWNCEGYGCNECPAKIQGKNPNVYYEVPYCSQAQTIDILRLERERVDGEQK